MHNRHTNERILFLPLLVLLQVLLLPSPPLLPLTRSPSSGVVKHTSSAPLRGFLQKALLQLLGSEEETVPTTVIPIFENSGFVNSRICRLSC